MIDLTKKEQSIEAIASEPAATFNYQSQAVEHLRYQGVETLMKIDDITSLQTLVPKIQKIYLYSVQGAKSSENIARINKSLDVISQYKDDWDDEGAPAIIPSVIDFVKSAISNCNDYLLEHWSIFPSNNGTLKMETHQSLVNAGINIGKDEFSYYIHAGTDEIYGKSSNTSRHLTNILTHVYYGE